ncbi:MAG: hypothetical protein V4629_01680 [Pseudomonadota bacterium]
MIGAIAQAGQAHPILPMDLEAGNLAQIQNVAAPQPRLPFLQNLPDLIRNPSPLNLAKIKSAIFPIFCFAAWYFQIQCRGPKLKEDFGPFYLTHLGISPIVGLAVSFWTRKQFIPLIPNLELAESLVRNIAFSLSFSHIELCAFLLNNHESFVKVDLEHSKIQSLVKILQLFSLFLVCSTTFFAFKPTVIQQPSSQLSTTNEFLNLNYNDISKIASKEEIALLNLLDICAITHFPNQEISQPVHIEKSPNIYEFNGLKGWLAGNPKNPMTDEIVRANDLVKIPRDDLLHLIESAKNK